jgi:hypothetical protein
MAFDVEMRFRSMGEVIAALTAGDGALVAPAPSHRDAQTRTDPRGRVVIDVHPPTVDASPPPRPSRLRPWLLAVATLIVSVAASVGVVRYSSGRSADTTPAPADARSTDAVVALVTAPEAAPSPEPDAAPRADAQDARASKPTEPVRKQTGCACVFRGRLMCPTDRLGPARCSCSGLCAVAPRDGMCTEPWMTVARDARANDPCTGYTQDGTMRTGKLAGCRSSCIDDASRKSFTGVQGAACFGIPIDDVPAYETQARTQGVLACK